MPILYIMTMDIGPIYRPILNRPSLYPLYFAPISNTRRLHSAPEPSGTLKCENERVFSAAAGLVTGKLRNRMGMENLAMLVYLMKNVDQNADE